MQTETYHHYIITPTVKILCQGQEAAGTNWNVGNCTSTYENKFGFFSFDIGQTLEQPLREAVDIQKPDWTPRQAALPDHALSKRQE